MTFNRELPKQCEDCPSKSEGIFCNLDQLILKDVSLNKVVNTYKKGQTLFLEGTPSFGVFCISQGNIKISKMGENGRESIVKIASKGDVLGPKGLFTESNYNTTATALEDSAVCFIDKKYISQLLGSNSTVAMNLMSKLTSDLETCETKLASLSYKNVREKLAGVLLDLVQSHGRPENGQVRIDLKLTRQELASLIGTATETLIRVLSEFKEEDLVELQGKNIYILNLEKLKLVA